jgi:uncharacterized protein YdeI (YjbR/CyaY-like superfamily)
MPVDDAPHIEPVDRAAWRAWLEANHATTSGVWLIAPRAARDRPVSYDEAVEEALCFGWIDGTAGSVDEHRSKQYFAPRRSGSGWARTNKARVERLLATGRLAPAGLATIERAKADGSWTLLDSVERLEIPADLAAALAASPPAREQWDAFPPSVRRAALAQLVVARRPQTRARRIEAIVTRAQRGERPAP